MIKKIFNIIKKVVFAFLILYGLNLTLSSTSLNIIIPINIITILLVTLLGFPGLCAIIILFLII
ncbi:MAG: pro-sigmaK processing inhibitor BofA family protein [Bacilli bacterium]